MTTDELEQLLAQQPVALLHRLARGRVHRQFRAGKRRLIELLLQHSSQNLAGLESDLQTLIEERQSRSEPRPSQTPRPSLPPPKKASLRGTDSEPLESAVSLSAWLEGIGVPSPQPFVPDPWQTEALSAVSETDVVISVPTGSGKTYVAVEAARRAMEDNRTVIYTSPLKALSNTKYTEFSKIFGSDTVGILTGDRQENGQAPLLIMTTEILRNLLYDAASGEIDIRLDTLGLVILDESQYLADPERGVVWEETIIFCPAQARLLLLSASIGNPQDIADWLTSIRSTACRLVRHSKRTVPLRAGYLHPNGKLTPLFRTPGIPYGHPNQLHPEAKRLFLEYEDETLPSGRHRR
ncbi:DEAD/DEAH box helicase [Candidatus Nitrospira nitrificans]|uniref:Putative Helicase (N-terminal) n=1 Tax=Candidatus Nitrospira nitrificans TaxID=1742973 RepID=A0A0S4L4U6_9BACT|nr:DEAD/DEAH box helicase [Candidatus Nitrospira nitrificans]CUS31712.1 putative Helicase (N-terminal) [Candidatus Nitrospira nitrificans]